MIELFIPKKINGYTFGKEYVLGLDITKSHIYGSLIVYTGREIILEKTFQEIIDQQDSSYTIRASRALSKIIEHVPQNTRIVSSLNSSFAVIKEFNLPFSEPEKIALVLNFELESHLPFSIHDAITDFIITKKDPLSHEATILASAVPKSYIKQHLDIYQALNVMPIRLTLDIFNLYGLFSMINYYSDNPKSYLLFNIDQQTTTIGLVVSNQLKNTRTITKGTGYLIKSISQETNNPFVEVSEDITRLGFQQYIKQEEVSLNIFNNYFQEIKLTLQSFITTSAQTTPFNSIILTGSGADILSIEKFMHDNLALPCDLFELNQLIRIPHFQIASTSMTRSHIISLASALDNPITDNFDVLKNEFAPSTTFFIKKNLIVTSILLVCIIAFLVIASTWKQLHLQRTIKTAEQAVIKALHNIDLADSRNFDKAIIEAQEKINKEEDLWFAFSRQRRFSFLQILQHMSLAIDRRSLGLNIKRLNLTSNEVLLEGKVRGFEELKVLERELRKSNLFAQIPTLQDLKFNERLILKKNEAGLYANN